MVEIAHAQWKIAIIKRKAGSNGETFHVIQEIDVAESINSDRFTTRSRIIALTAVSCLKQAALDRL